jgi:hypothetical protein
VLAQMLVFPIFGLQTSLADNLAIGAVFTAISLARSYTLRRVFEGIRVHGPGAITAGQIARRHRPF